MDFSIRTANLADAPALEALIPLSVRALQAKYYTDKQMTGALGTIFGVDTQLIKDGTYFVAEAGRAVIAGGGWSRRKAQFGGDRGKSGPDPELNPLTDAARIRAFFVHPEWARRGVGSAIMNLCEAAARGAGFSRIDIVATLVGELLYQRFGYIVVERFEISLPNEEKLPAVLMRKADFLPPPA